MIEEEDFECPPCRDTGRINAEGGRYTVPCPGKAHRGQKCPTCKGAGYMDGACLDCGGTGKKLTSAK